MAPLTCHTMVAMSSSGVGKADNKHLMTGHKGNSEFCFPEMLNVGMEH